MTWNWEDGLELRRPYRLRSILCQATDSTAIGCRDREGQNDRGEAALSGRTRTRNTFYVAGRPSRPKIGVTSLWIKV
jgi:hypothetical protein